jgi:hypothetical protein
LLTTQHEPAPPQDEEQQSLEQAPSDQSEQGER